MPRIARALALGTRAILEVREARSSLKFTVMHASSLIDVEEVGKRERYRVSPELALYLQQLTKSSLLLVRYVRTLWSE